MRRRLLLLVVLAVVSPRADAASFYFSPDVPTDDPSGAATVFLPWEVVRNDAGTYTLKLSFPQNTPLDALHQMCSGNWLISVEAPTSLGGTEFDPRDVIRFDPVAGSYSLFFGGAGAGIPPGANVDAAFLNGDDSAPLVLSFDTPTTIGAVTYDAADLVRYAGGAFTLFFDASAATPPVPTESDVSGADRWVGKTVLTFDVPTTLGLATYLPGELVSWDGSAFASLYADPNWPVTSRLDAMSFLADPGSVTKVLVDKSALIPGNLRLTWTAATSAGGEDYGIYEGAVGTWYSHTAVDCSDNGGDRAEEVAPGGGNRYYLVVPLNPDLEGSYGRSYGGSERPVGSPNACRPVQGLDCP